MSISLVITSLKQAEDTVSSIEHQYSLRNQDVNWHVGLQNRTSVATQELNEACDSKEITYMKWQELSRRVYAVQDALVDAGLWRN